jgi:hypothetical protein
MAGVASPVAPVQRAPFAAVANALVARGSEETTRRTQSRDEKEEEEEDPVVAAIRMYSGSSVASSGPAAKSSSSSSLPPSSSLLAAAAAAAAAAGSTAAHATAAVGSVGSDATMATRSSRWSKVSQAVGLPVARRSIGRQRSSSVVVGTLDAADKARLAAMEHSEAEVAMDRKLDELITATMTVRRTSRLSLSMPHARARTHATRTHSRHAHIPHVLHTHSRTRSHATDCVCVATSSRSLFESAWRAALGLCS